MTVEGVTLGQFDAGDDDEGEQEDSEAGHEDPLEVEADRAAGPDRDRSVGFFGAAQLWFGDRVIGDDIDGDDVGWEVRGAGTTCARRADRTHVGPGAMKGLGVDLGADGGHDAGHAGADNGARNTEAGPEEGGRHSSQRRCKDLDQRKIENATAPRRPLLERRWRGAAVRRKRSLWVVF